MEANQIPLGHKDDKQNNTDRESAELHKRLFHHKENYELLSQGE